jgi:hypothetical protein
MAEEQTPENGGDGRRLSISERTVRDIVENAILRLQIELGNIFAAKADVDRVQALAKDVADNATRSIISLQEALAEQAKQIKSLEEDKAGRDAVTNFKKWLTGGAIFGSIGMVVMIALTIYGITHGHKP